MVEYTVRVHSFSKSLSCYCGPIAFLSVNTLCVPPIDFLKVLQHRSQSEKIGIEEVKWH